MFKMKEFIYKPDPSDSGKGKVCVCIYIYRLVVVEGRSEKEVKLRNWYGGGVETSGEGLGKKLFRS